MDIEQLSVDERNVLRRLRDNHTIRWFALDEKPYFINPQMDIEFFDPAPLNGLYEKGLICDSKSGDLRHTYYVATLSGRLMFDCLGDYEMDYASIWEANRIPDGDIEGWIQFVQGLVPALLSKIEGLKR